MSDPREALATQVCEAAGKFRLGDPVRKIRGSQWSGRIVGTYSTELTPEGYAVESFTERGSVQIYPAAALEACEETGECVAVPRELLERSAYNIAYAVFNLAGKKLSDLRPGLIESCDPAMSALIAERDLRALLAQHGKAVGDE